MSNTPGRSRSGPTFIPSSDGVCIAVHDLGGPEDPERPALLFSHATGFHGLVWAPVAAFLTAQFHCLALDYRGHGVSETPATAGFEWGRMGDDARAVRESGLFERHRNVHGIGHSMGGAALVLAAARSKAFRSLWLYEPVIVGPGVLPASDAPNPMADAAARRRPSFTSYEEALANFAAKPPLQELHPDALEAYVREGFAVADDGRVTLRCAPATEAAVFRGAGESGAWEVLPILDLPVAIVGGRSQDGEAAESVAALAPPAFGRLARGTLSARPDLGHFGPLEDPSGIARDIAAWVESHT
jgi:pimeloyl-ACP methyl ester carboxylesterase